MIVKKILNLFLFISSTYIPIAITSFLLQTLTKDTQSTRIEHERRIEEDSPQIKRAINKGYLPHFFPEELSEYYPQNSIYYPLSTLPNQETYFCNEGYGLIKYTTDKLGFRNKNSIYKNIDNPIFLVGDSFVHGACVEKENIFSSQISSILDRKTFNFGVSSNGPLEYISTIKNVIKPLKKIVTGKSDIILFIFSNDNLKYRPSKVEKVFSSRTPIIINGDQISINIDYTNQLKKIISKNITLDPNAILSRIEEMNKRLNPNRILVKNSLTLLPIRSMLKAINIDIKNFSQSKDIFIEDLLFKTLKEVCINKCQAHIVYLPPNNFMRKDPRSKFYKQKIEKLSEEFKFNFIDAEEVISSNNRNDFAPKGPHYSKDGYIKVSKLISAEIEKSQTD